MDFAAAAHLLQPGEGSQITRWNAEKLRHLKPLERAPIKTLLDCLGRSSALAQGLKGVITTYDKLSSTDHTVYIASFGSRSSTLVKGFLKVGNKTLFVTSEGNPQLREIRPLCVLDFYVHESCQRTGVGRFLFDHMLSEQSFLPAKLAYDRPSPKLLAFLKKHFGLYKYVPQTNNFVVFNEYFLGPERAGSSLKQRGFEETALKQDGSMRWNAALRNRVPEHQKRGSEECTQGAENERMRTCVRRNSGGGQIFESVDENAARALEGEQCSGSQSDSIFGEHAKQAPNIPMHGRRSRRGSSETDSSLGATESGRMEEEPVHHAPAHGRRASCQHPNPWDQLPTTGPSRHQASPSKQGSSGLKRSDELRDVSAVARTVKTMHMSGKGAAEVLGANTGFLVEAYKDAYRQTLPRSRQRRQ